MLAQVASLLARYLERYQLAPILSEEEVRHWLCMRTDVVFTYVVEGAGGAITDFFSFYTLPSTVIGNDTYNSLKVGLAPAHIRSVLPGAHPISSIGSSAVLMGAPSWGCGYVRGTLRLAG
jgi:glycylpeptide N-tetradecanoyltransferase